MKIGVCGNFALDHLAAALDRAVLDADIIVGDSGKFSTELSNRPGDFANLDICVVALDWRDLAPGVDAWGFGDDFAAATLSFHAACGAVEAALKKFRSASPARLLVFSPVSACGGAEGFVDRLLEPSHRELSCRCQARFDALCRSASDIYPVDVDEIIRRLGADNAFDSNGRYVCNNPFTAAMTLAVAQRIASSIMQFVRYPLKCLVLDCDDTLWGGVVGEAGMDGILLSDTGPGKAFFDFQAAIVRLYKQGVILAVCTKNNTCDALEVFERHPHMLVRPKMISCFRINWDDKPKNVLGISEELNIGLDSMMFADDNPAERAMMKAALPGVEVLELPSDPSLYPDTLARCTRFWPLQITPDDAAKGSFFAAERQRKQARELAASIESYLVKSDIRATAALVNDTSMPRIAQLFAKTNQFNLTTQRYTQAQLEAFAADSHNRLYSLSMKDMYGDYGTIASALILGDTIDSYILSCRVFGKRAENAFLAWILRTLKDSGTTRAYGLYTPTEKNAMTKDFYKNSGFDFEKTENERDVWRYDLTKPPPEVPRWIRFEDPETSS